MKHWFRYFFFNDSERIAQEKGHEKLTNFFILSITLKQVLNYD